MIYLPPPQPVAEQDIRIHGDVEIHPTASLAPGAILQAAPNSRIVIGANVCVGMGTIINAIEGSVEIESGVTLGAGVLIIGESKIGNNACIGTATTIFQASISAMQVVEPGSIIGDSSRKVEDLDVSEELPTEDEDDRELVGNNHSPKNSTSDRESAKNNNNRINKASEKLKTDSLEKPDTDSNEDRQNSELEISKKNGKPVVGQVYINELLVTLFPHRKIGDS